MHKRKYFNFLHVCSDELALQIANSAYAVSLGYESFSDVGESQVWWRAGFQSGVKKGVLNLFLSISMAYNVISCPKVAENTQILKIAKFAM